ncbi:hypothetical protein KKA85_01630 [bacterium]|nr:hypothetical protein [bacterium]MBU1674460.1 hypothetical protein [bacterium]
MNTLELVINQSLERHPLLKTCLKNTYQYLGSKIPRRNYIPDRTFLSRPGYYFGFHDLSPWSSRGDRILAHRIPPADRRMVQVPDYVEVGWFHGSIDGDFEPIDVTTAFNWQEGARLQWVGDSEAVIYNRFNRDRLTSVLVDGPGVHTDVGRPIYTVDPRGRHALAVDFARLGRYSLAYSYRGLARPSHNTDATLDLVDLETGTLRSLANVSDIMQADPRPTMDGAFHFLSHATFSPLGTRVAFMHCWLTRNCRLSRLHALDLETGEIRLLRSNDWVSHYCWLDERRILTYDEARVGRRGFRIHDIGSETIEDMARGQLIGDGHPWVSPGGRWLLVDTYPSRFMEQELILFDLLKNDKKTLFRARIPFRFRNEHRCDFHPRMSPDGTKACFDSAHEGVRSLCVLELGVGPAAPKSPAEMEAVG